MGTCLLSLRHHSGDLKSLRVFAQSKTSMFIIDIYLYLIDILRLVGSIYSKRLNTTFITRL